MELDWACEGWDATFEPPHLSESVAQHLLAALLGINEDWLREHPDTPTILDGRVRYQDHPRWSSVPKLRARGYGDCKSIVTARVAELRVRGIPARVVTSDWRRPGRCLFHVQAEIMTPGGLVIEDTSTLLGMRL